MRLLTTLALTAVVASGSSAHRLPVTLTVHGATQLAVGTPVTLIARAKLPRGGRLVIEAGPGIYHVNVASCRRSPCVGSWTPTDAEEVDFQALATRRIGTKTTTLGRSKLVTVSWTGPSQGEPPPPPPAPAALPGHYEGRTSQNEIFRFDITSDGLGLTNFQTGQINQSCDPPEYLSGGNFGPDPQIFKVGFDGSFALSGSGPWMVDQYPATYNYVLKGEISGGTASGTWRFDSTFTTEKTTYTCSSGDQTWSATKTS